ncbi:hypothetical protein EDB85DRAFT_963313 [Lactarius pseudohatsudake]|nr:hypothetical protein EDB85DRAFT_963313 [Lactarius pseudohatsudake]
MSSPLVEQCSPSARSAIIRDRPQSAKVTPLPYSHPLVQLHRKFWLQSLLDVPENESTNIDKDEGDDEGDETGPGCYILNLGIPDIWPELLVRKEYIRLYEFCDKYLGSHCDDPSPPSVVITGQPGIGKSYWPIYALCRRLAEKKPVIWFHSTQRYLFVEEGVFVVPPDYSSTDFKARIWTLIDADDCWNGIPDYLAPHRTKHSIILCSSPQSARWKRLSKTTECTIAIMDPWTREEISKAAVIYGLKANDPRIDEMYNHYGPTPRICFNFVRNEATFAAHEACYESALRKLSLRKLSDMAFDEVNFDKDDESHSLILLTRLPRDGGDDVKFFYGRLEPITHMIKLKLRNQLRTETQAARIALYKKLANVEGTRHIAGVVYESLAQEMLEEKIALKLVPMVKQDSNGSGRGKKFPRWHSNHGDGANRSLVLPIDITPAETFVYPEYGLDHPIKDRVYYVSEAQHQVAFDSFIMAEGKLYIFQFATGSDHPIKKGMFRFFSKMVPGALPPLADWHFVLVVPPSISEICCSPQLQDDDLKELLAEMNIFSAVLDCDGARM